MKSIIAIIILMSNMAFAQLDVVENEVVRTVAQLDNIDNQIKSLKLNESGVLTIAQRQGGSITVKLTDSNRNQILTLAHNLTEAEVQTDIRAMVCKMFVNPNTATDLSIIDLNTDSLRLVLSYSSCALSNYTYPVNENHLNAARILKSQLVVLAQQVVSNMNYNIQPMPSNLE